MCKVQPAPRVRRAQQELAVELRELQAPRVRLGAVAVQQAPRAQPVRMVMLAPTGQPVRKVCRVLLAQPVRREIALIVLRVMGMAVSPSSTAMVAQPQ